MSDPAPNRIRFNQTVQGAVRFFRECKPVPENDTRVHCIECLADQFPPERAFDPASFRAELSELIDPDLRESYLPPVDHAPEFDEDTFAQIALAQTTRELNRLLPNLAGAGLGRMKLAELWTGAASEDPCAPSPEPWPALPPLSTTATLLHAAWTPGLAPFGNPAYYPDVITSLGDLAQVEPLEFRLSSHTGLAGTLQGDNLLVGIDADDDDRLAATARFFDSYAPALTGPSGRWGEPRSDAGDVVRVRQTSPDGIPVYGGVMIAGYDSQGRLTFVNNSCYPVPDAAFAERFTRSRDEAFRLAAGFVRAKPDDGALAPPEAVGDREDDGEPDFIARPADDFFPPDDPRAGQVVLPMAMAAGNTYVLEQDYGADPDQATAEYLPAWAVSLTDEIGGRSWTVFINADLASKLPVELATIEDTAAAAVLGAVYPTVAHALKVNGLDAVVQQIAESVSGTLQGAPNFALTRPGGVVPAAGDADAMRFTNSYFHLARARERFQTVIAQAWPNPADRPQLPGDLAPFPVEINTAAESARYVPGSRKLILTAANPNAAFPYGDSTVDPEVIYHEFTHAVMHLVQRDLFKTGNAQFRRAINEGLAFYFACSLSDWMVRSLAPAAAAAVARPHRWGKVSHAAPVWTNKSYRDLERWQTGNQPGAQRADHDYLSAYGVFPAFTGGFDDPDDEHYAVGMLWARTLWDIRQVLGPDLADAMIMRAMTLAGGVQSDLETPAEAILHVDRTLATANRPSHEAALRLIFASRGIFADSPIRKLVRLHAGQGNVLLAATESPLPGDTSCGCLISQDGGLTWRSLGIGGTRDVVALAWLPVSANRARIWIAGETWTTGVAPDQPVFRYELDFDNTGAAINLDDPWQMVLQPLATPAAIRCLAATPINPDVPGGESWLFAGTENGVFKFDGAKWPETAVSETAATPNIASAARAFAVQDLAVVAQGGRRLLIAATASTLDVHLIVEPAQSADNNGTAFQRLKREPGSAGLCLASDAATGSQVATVAWAGVIDKGVLRYDLAAAPPDFAQIGGAWPAAGPPVILALASENNEGQLTLIAGANRGLFRKIGAGNWQKINLQPVELSNTAILSLCRVGGGWLLGTAQRGLWLCTDLGTGAATRVVSGIARLGAALPTGPGCNGFDSQPLAAGAVAVQVAPVLTPPAQAVTLTVQARPGDVIAGVDLFRASVNLAVGSAAGVQRVGPFVHQADGSHRFVLPAGTSPGYYLAAVRAGEADVCWKLTAT